VLGGAIGAAAPDPPLGRQERSAFDDEATMTEPGPKRLTEMVSCAG
jgi:hypothetical protein